MVYTYVDPFKTFAALGQEFDKMFKATAVTSNYPPHNLIKEDDENFVLEFAVAGFKKENISISVENGVLTVAGEKPDADETNYVHKGIATRRFTRSFSLPEYFEVGLANYEDGILSIDLFKDVPEEKKPKTIAIQ